MLFVVIVLPIVLDQEPKPVLRDLSVQIPSQDGGRFNTRVLPPLPPPPAMPEKGGSAQPSETAPEKKPEATKSESKPEPKSAKAAARVPAKADAADGRRAQALLNDEVYVVPLGAFANADNAKNVQDKAASAGIKSYAEKIKGPQGEQTRVRAGPFQSKDAAEKARDKLKSLGLAVGRVAQR
ncbi:MAG: SPOR domain-containing protein [Burkholderiales bacterium]